MQLSRQHIGDHVADGAHRPLEIHQLGLAMLHPLEKAGKDIHQAAQAGIGRQRAQQGLGRDELIGQMLDVGGRQEQQAVALEEGAAVGPVDDGEKLGILLQPRRQRRGRLFRQLGREGVDDDRDLVGLHGKGPVEGRLMLAPGKVRGEELDGVGVDGEVMRRIAEGSPGDHQEEQHDLPGMAAAEVNDMGKGGSRHRDVREVRGDGSEMMPGIGDRA